MGADNSYEERESTDVLIGKTLEDARQYIKANEVYFGDSPHAVTEIHVSKKDGKPQSGYKDIRRSAGRMRLRVYTEKNVIVYIDRVH